jgi:putative transposase
MNFENGHLYHIYNQGNNKQIVFYSEENYLFFLEKIKKHIIPYADILAWCLMPNHFHLLVYVNDLKDVTTATHPMIPSHRMSNQSHVLTLSNQLKQMNKQIIEMSELSQSIAILLRSYTRAINKEEMKSGSLFRPHTKAICLTKAESITPSYFNSPFGTYLNLSIPEREYPQLCFNYIHNNPVKAKLVNHAEDWEFSSFKDYCGLRKGKLISRERAIEFGLKIN